MNRGQPAPELRSVGRSYGRIVALQEVSLGVEAGEMIGVLGPNGAGKTTLFQLAAGLAAPDRGAVRLFGRDPVRDGPRDGDGLESCSRAVGSTRR